MGNENQGKNEQHLRDDFPLQLLASSNCKNNRWVGVFF